MSRCTADTEGKTSKIRYMNRSEFLRLLLSGAATTSIAPRVRSASKESRKLVLLAGSPSHPPGMHEFRAGSLLLEKRLVQVPGLTVERYDNGWVEDEATLADADAIVIYADGNRHHPLADKRRLALVGEQMARGAGLGCMHYGVEVRPDDAGEEFKSWLGGFYEHEWSCNPIWTPSFEQFPDHPVANGVRPFAIEDEWYFNMRFRDGFDATGAPTEIDGDVDSLRFWSPSPVTKCGMAPTSTPRVPYAHIQAAKGRDEAMLWTLETRRTAAADSVSPGATSTETGRTTNSARWSVNADVLGWLDFRVPKFGHRDFHRHGQGNRR